MSSWHLASSSIVAFPVPLRTTISLGALSGAAGAAVATVDEPEVDESYVFEWYVGFGDCSTLVMTLAQCVDAVRATSPQSRYIAAELPHSRESAHISQPLPKRGGKAVSIVSQVPSDLPDRLALTSGAAHRVWEPTCTCAAHVVSYA